MSRKKRNIKKILLIALSVIVIVFFALNWFLTHRLEGLLHKTLSNKVSTATNGFYKLTFDNLSVGLFSGELKITGLDLRPDSVVYNKWASGDTLPDTYFKLHIDTIDFKGINLTWRVNYRKLHFNLFELVNPEVEVVKPYLEKDTNNNLKVDTKDSESLYEMVSPFFDVVSVERLSLEHATVSYTMADSIVPAVYSLKDVSFRAYGFLLDENSSESGKLLLFDNFEFTTNRPQTLIVNNKFTLTTEALSLNTRDSLIDIRDLSLLPQKKIWFSTGKWPDDFVKAQIPIVQVKGAAFFRNKGESYFNASLLSILSSDIEYFKIDTILQKKVQKKREKVSFNDWSLYDIVSPVLKGVTIDSIGVKDTKFSYIQVTDKGVDSYKLNNFNFWANRFSVDKLSEHNTSKLYSTKFGFNATDFVCEMKTKNHRFDIDRIYMDTGEETFYVKGIRLEPISQEKQYDYVSGTIDSISIMGLNTEKSFKASRLMVKSPNVKYVRNYTVRKPKDAEVEDIQPDVEKPNTIDVVVALMNEYYVKEILLDSANFTYRYTKPNQLTQELKIENFNFFAHDFLINDYTRQNVEWYFTCNDFGFNLSRFDNYILDNTYRLSAKDISFTGINGKLRLRDVKLLPQDKKWIKSPDKYLTLTSPFIEFNGLDYKNKSLIVADFTILSPYAKFIEVRSTQGLTAKPKAVSKKSNSTLITIEKLLVNSVNIKNANVEYQSKPLSTTMQIGLQALNINNLLWNLLKTKELRIKDIEFTAPKIDFASTQSKINNESLKHTVKHNTTMLDKLMVDRFVVSDLQIRSENEKLKADAKLYNLSLSKLNWKFGGADRFFSLNNITISEPEIQAQVYSHLDTLGVIANKPSETDVYKMLSPLSDKIWIGNFNLTKANVDYDYFVNGRKLNEQKINDLDFAFKGLDIDNISKKVNLEDVSFYTKNLSFPINKGFYTIKIDSIRLTPKGEDFRIDNLQMISLYPKQEFAYYSPNHKDWFGLNVGSVAMKGLDLPRFLTQKELNVTSLNVRDVLLENFKNKKIEVQHNIVPMIYEGLQKAPFKLKINDVDVRNFSVVYEELPQKGLIPGKIFFKGINGHLSNVTNVAEYPKQFIQLDADGNLMNDGYFTATWKIPVSPENDRFILDAHIRKFNFSDLNPIITPLAPVRIKSGALNEAFINMDASTKGGQIEMKLLYNNLYVDFLSHKNGTTTVKKLPTRFINWIIRDNNPRKIGSKPKVVDIYVERDPYHSTFNYLVQMIMPAMAESVGVSYDQQKFAKSIPSMLKRVQEFFWRLPKTAKKEVDKE